MAALIRDVVDRVIAESDAVVRDRLALAAVGRHSSGRTDVAVRHDAYLTDTA